MAYAIIPENLADFPSVLREARRFGRYSQREVAQAVGVTEHTIGMWEKEASVIQKGKRAAAAAFIASTGFLEAKERQGADTCDDPRAYVLGRLATGPAFSWDEAMLALTLGVHHDITGVKGAVSLRLLTGPRMSLGDHHIFEHAVGLEALQSLL